MQRSRMMYRLFVPALAAALMFSACSKEAPQPERSPAAPRPEVSKSVEAPQAAETPSTNVTIAGPSVPPPLAPAEPSAETALEVAELEKAYVSNTAFTARVQLIYKLTDVDTAEAVGALGRCFQLEKDPNLRIEVLDSLSDIDGLDDQKVAILAAGASADQPQEVRESAIDGLTDIDPKKALPILQALLSDPDEDIRDATKDAIESVQDAMNNPPQAPAP